jgi:hypothetical protein
MLQTIAEARLQNWFVVGEGQSLRLRGITIGTGKRNQSFDQASCCGATPGKRAIFKNALGVNCRCDGIPSI